MKHFSIPEFAVLLGKMKFAWGFDLESIRDCERFSENIFFVTNERISASTIFRWFVLGDFTHKPYRNTLETVNKYLDLKQENKNHIITNYKTIYPDNNGLEFISLSLQNGEWKGFLAYLKRMPNFHVDLDQSVNFANRIGEEIRNSVQLQKGLIPELVKSEQGRLFLIEMYCDQDNLEGYYQQTLEKYLTVFPNKGQVKIIEDFLFATHLLVLSYILQKKTSEIKNLQIELDKITPIIIKTYHLLHPMPKLRYHLLNVLFSKLNLNFDSNKENQTIINIDLILKEYPVWSDVMLFEFSKTAAMLNWNEAFDYIIEKLLQPSPEKMSSTSYYVEYIAEIIHKFSQNKHWISPVSTTIKQVDFKQYMNQIIRIQATLNNLK